MLAQHVLNVVDFEFGFDVEATIFGTEIVNEQEIAKVGSEETVDIANEVVAVENEDHVEVALEKR